MISAQKPHGGEEWLYVVNYYGQLGNDVLENLAGKYGRIIVDNAQAYFQMPLEGVDTIYTCRKFLGVADGAFLYTDAMIEEELPRDESFERMRFLLGRFERTASEFYPEYAANNGLFAAMAECYPPYHTPAPLLHTLQGHPARAWAHKSHPSVVLCGFAHRPLYTADT